MTRCSGQLGKRHKTSRRFHQGSTLCIAQLASKDVKAALTSPPSSLPTKSQFLRLCGPRHSRKAWLFFGSDDHASAAANLFSLVASCKLHGLDAEAYLADVIRVMPYWPTDRYVELAPKFWTDTRARLDPEEINLPLGRVSVPPPLTAEKQASTN